MEHLNKGDFENYQFFLLLFGRNYQTFFTIKQFFENAYFKQRNEKTTLQC